MSDIFREVDEALQQEKAVRFWKEYGPTVILAAIVLVLSTAATTGWMTWNAARNATETARVVGAMEEGDSAAAALQEIAKDTRSNHEALALLSAAGLLNDQKEFLQAAALYQQIYDDSSAPRELRDLARVLHVRSQLAAGGEDTQSAALLDILKPVLSNDKGPWQWQAKIDAALIAAHRDQNFAAAAAYLEGADEVTTIPPSLSLRARALHQLYTAQAATTPATEAQE